MTNFFGNKRLIAILIGLIVLIAVMGATLKERPVPTWPERFAKDSVSFVQGIFYKPTAMLSGFFDNIKHIYNVYDENKVLKSQLDQHAKLQVEVEALRRENKQLRSMMDISVNKLGGSKPYVADVIARTPDRWNNMLTIGKGKMTASSRTWRSYRPRERSLAAFKACPLFHRRWSCSWT